MKPKRLTSLKFICYTATILAVALLCIVAMVTSYLIHSHNLDKRYIGLRTTVAQSVKGIVALDNAENYLNGLNSEEHIRDNIRLQNLADDMRDIHSIGMYKFTNDGMYIIFDTTSDHVRGGVGEYYKYTKEWEAGKESFLNGEVEDELLVSFSKGPTALYCMPVQKTDDGYIYVCVGVLKSLTQNMKTDYLAKNSLGILATSLIFLILASVYIKLKIVKPINNIAELVEKAVKSNDSKLIDEIIEKNVKSVKEVENINRSLIKIYTAKVRLNSVMSKEGSNRSSAVLSIIKRMDNFYALHLDNSLQYVMLLISEMRKTEKYKDIITDKDYDDMLIAAQFHDIGKLVIPSRILSKPSSLTDDEYEIIKQHTTLGVQMIQDLYDGREPESYMIMAEQIVKYHHERWDGNGYPEGLKGEEIPLYARVVTVVDVFDALVSKRIYKDAYSFEEAFSMIEKDRGTKYDPDIVDIFVSQKEKFYDLYLKITSY